MPTVKAKSEHTEDYTSHHSSDIGLPDMEVHLEGIGRAILHHSQGLQVAFIPRPDSDKQIGVSVITLSDEGDFPYEAWGLVYMLSNEEALAVGESLIRLVKDGPNMGDKAKAN